MISIQITRPSKNTLSYTPYLLPLIVAMPIAMLLIWPAEESTVFGLTSKWLYKPFVNIYCVSVLGLYMIHKSTTLLDKYIKWEESFVERIIYQLVLCWVFPLFLTFYCAFDLFCLQRIDLIAIIESKHMYVAILGLPLLVNFGYLVYYFFKLSQITGGVTESLEGEEPYPKELVFQQSETLLKVNVSEIAYVIADGRNTIIKRNSKEQIYLKFVYIRDIEEMLNPAHFCRVNRSFIISRTSYVSHRKHNRGLQLFLHPATLEPVHVGRFKVKEVLDFVRKRNT